MAVGVVVPCGAYLRDSLSVRRKEHIEGAELMSFKLSLSSRTAPGCNWVFVV